MIFVGPEGRVSALLPPGGLSSLEMGMGTASGVLGVVVPTKKGGNLGWGGVLGWRRCLLPPTPASPGGGGASCTDARRGLVARGEPLCWAPRAALASPAAAQAVSLAGLSRAFVLQVELNVKTFGDPNYYL